MSRILYQRSKNSVVATAMAFYTFYALNFSGLNGGQRKHQERFKLVENRLARTISS